MEFASLMRQCWSEDRNMRPSISDIGTQERQCQAASQQR